MEDVELGSESETDLQQDVTASTVTITSSKFRQLSVKQEEEKDREDNEGVISDTRVESRQVSPSQIAQPRSTTVSGGSKTPQLLDRSLISDSGLKSPTSSLETYSTATVIGLETAPSQLNQSLTKSKSAFRKDGTSSDRPVPVYYMELKRLRGSDKYDVFSDDEEPVLRTSFVPYVPEEPECPKPVIKMENIVVYDVRGAQQGELSQNLRSETSRATRDPSPSTVCFSRSSFARRRSTRQIPTSTPLECKFLDLTPHQRDLRNVSFGELSPVEVAIVKGLWKCITNNLWTFGVLTTINFFRIRGHIAFNDQKATPEEMMKCRFLWPHANHAMKSLEDVVLKLHKPEESQEIVYDLGKKHGNLKIPLNDEQSEMVINSFLYTFHQHVHPKMTLKEMNILRKFSNITMSIFVDASRWDSEPLPLY